MDFTIDTTEIVVDVNEAENQISAIANRFGFAESSARSIYITAAPSVIPSVSPIISAPTSQPIITGLVVSIELSTFATESLSTSVLANLESTVSNAYGVNPIDVMMSTKYTAFGVISAELHPDQSEDAALAELASALATSLGISVQDIHLFVNYSFFFCDILFKNEI